MARPATLRRPDEFNRVMLAGTKVRGRYLVVHVLPSELRSRVGFVCGKAVGRAVVRNRGRRMLREAWREVLPRLDGAFEVVVVARPAIVAVTSSNAARDMASALATAGALLE